MFSRALPLCSFLALAACGDDVVGLDASTTADATVVRDASANPDAGPNADAAPNADATARDASSGDATASDASVDAGTGPRSIVFLHTNDEHSHELGFGPEVDDYPPRVSTGIRGGVLRRTVVLEQLRGEARTAGSPVSLVSAGDLMMGSLFHLANPARGIDYAIASLLGYDVMTLGNQEFDLGVNALAGALRTGGIDALGNPGVVQIPIVASNIRFSASAAGDDLLAALYSTAGDATHPLRRTFIKRHGSGATAVRVGYFGLMGLDASAVSPFKTPVRFSLANNGQACSRDLDCPRSVCLAPAATPTAQTGQCAINTDESDPMHFAALVADAAGAVAELRAQGVDLVVAVSHVGVDDRELATLEAMNMPASDARKSEEILLAKGVDQALAASGIAGIDVIIGGHSHTAIERPITIPSARTGGATYIVQAGHSGLHIGKLRLTQASGGAPWILDDTFSGLEPVDDTIDPALASGFLAQIIGGAIDQVMVGLESQVIAVAGDRLIFPGEQCDGTTLPNNGACIGLVPGATGGTLTCLGNRQLDLTGCLFAHASCGNGTLEGVEQCDGITVPSCESLGYNAGGTVTCSNNCAVNVSSCGPHFPSLLEVVVNFAQEGSMVRDDVGTPGDLFFYSLGTTTFAVPEPLPSQESNLLNLVTDAARATSNRLIPEIALDPIRVAINANGIVRDGIYPGRTGSLTVEDLFRVLPLGVSPVETTPTYTLTDFWVRADELVRGLEVGVGRGYDSDSFWLGVSGARVDYDLSRPVGDRVMRVVLLDPSVSYPFDDAFFESVALYDRANGGYPDASRLLHISTNFYIGLFLENLGICARTQQGAPIPQCAPCSMNGQCTSTGSTCDTVLGRCVGPVPAAVATRTLMPVTSAELKDFLALTTYVRDLGNLPTAYDQRTPRRLCCVGTACPADRSRSCD